MKPSELQELSCGISLLHGFESVPSWKDWTVGQHGVRASWRNRQGSLRSSTFLPEVAHEQGWNHLETIQALVRKAGDTFQTSMLEEMKLTRYQSSKVAITYEEYRNAIESRKEA